jgi:2,5-dichloro-2,5-cyclohexadiene-1,4-diol dehydrogenase 2
LVERKPSCSPAKALGSSSAISPSIPIIKDGDLMDTAFDSLFIASNEVGYLTGAELWIDGGWNAGN